MKYYIDCEFDGHNGDLLSLAIIREDGYDIYIKVNNVASDNWVLNNVVKLLDSHQCSRVVTVDNNEVGGVIKAFLSSDQCPVIVSDSPVDIYRFCKALSTGLDGEWSSTEIPRMQFNVINIDCYPTNIEDAVQHNAWWDTLVLKDKIDRC